MKQSAKNLASAVMAVAEDKGNKEAAKQFFNWLKRKNYLKQLPAIFVALDQVLADQGKIVAKVITRYPLSVSNKSEIKIKIGKIAKTDQVEIKEIIDERVIAGVKIIIGDKIIDGTIKSRLNSLKQQLS